MAERDANSNPVANDPVADVGEARVGPSAIALGKII
jgi:hypothetical protein